MDFNFNDEQQMLRDGATKFLLDNYSFECRRRTIQTLASCDPAIWSAFADLGWLALTIPQDAGGLGAGLFEATLLAEAMGRSLVVEPFATTAILCAGIVERCAAASMRSAMLAEIAAGTLRVALACLEPRNRYEFFNPTMSARRIADGFILNGSKQLVQDAPAAQQFIVSALADDGSGSALFVVNADALGVSPSAYALVDGRRAADVDFRDVHISSTAVLCTGASATMALDAALDRFAIFRVADAIGAMEAAMDLTAAHLRNRKQFGQPLAGFQALQHRMAEMFVEIQQTRSALFHALAFVDADPLQRNAAVSSAVVVSIDAGRMVGGQGIQLHGGVGITEEYQVGHYFKRLLSQEKIWGDTDYHLDRIARTYL